MVSQPAAGNSLRKERGSSLRKAEARIPHISNSRYSEKIFKNIKKCESCRKLPPLLGIQAHKTNILIWEMFMSASMKAAIHIGSDKSRRTHPEVGIKQAKRDSECEND